MAKTHPLLSPYEPSEDEPFDAVRAAHLLNRAGFGGTPEEVQRVRELGPQAAADRLLDFPDAAAEEQDAEDLPDLSAVADHPRTFREVRQLLAGKDRPERMEILQKLRMASREALAETARWWLRRMAYGRHPLQEKLAFLWHGHFTTSARDERNSLLLFQQNELLRKHAAGNFGAFVKAVSRDPAMLDYLNNQQNRRQKPNENYARELMELFTLGIGHYTEQDIKEAARAFTGWAHDGEKFQLRAFDHDPGEKTFFGQRGRFGGDDIIDILLEQRQCAKYIAGKLFAHFARSDVEEELAESLGDVLRENGYELRPLLRTIFTSRAFYEQRAIGSQIKSPVQLVVGTLRLLGRDLPPTGPLMRALDQMGQRPFDPPNVKGWPGGRAWINTSTIFVRYNTAAWLAGGEPPFGGPRRRRPAKTDHPDPIQGTPDQIVDGWVSRLIPRPIDEGKKQALLDALKQEAEQQQLVQLIVSMPEYQLC